MKKNVHYNLYDSFLISPVMYSAPTNNPNTMDMIRDACIDTKSALIDATQSPNKANHVE